MSSVWRADASKPASIQTKEKPLLELQQLGTPLLTGPLLVIGSALMELESELLILKTLFRKEARSKCVSIFDEAFPCTTFSTIEASDMTVLFYAPI